MMRQTASMRSLLGIAASPSGSSKLVATYDPDEFAAAPIGRCIVGATFAIWCHSPELQGALLWGTLDERAVVEMLHIAGFARHASLSSRRRLLIDCRDVDRVEADMLLKLGSIARDHLVSWTTAVEREAVIVPPTLCGVLIAGALRTLQESPPLQIARDPEQAIAFIDHPAAQKAFALAARIVGVSRGRASLLSRLRVQLSRELVTATAQASAAALGLSTRTLQRELRRLDTSFSDELRHARLAAAEALLLYTDLEIGVIATRVGFSSADQMDALLRVESKVTAGELRARRPPT
jgi:AraC-like DNA-binding protein